MESLILLFVHLLVLALVLGLLYWLMTAVVGLLPPPVGQVVRILLMVMIVFIAISVLLGEVGLWGDWGVGYHWRHRW